MDYKVRRSDNYGMDDEILSFPTEKAAEKMIDEELEVIKDMLEDYDYGEFFYEDGMTTEIWAPGEDVYTSWTRLWTKQTSVL